MPLEVNFPHECVEDIFRHLDFKDLMECSLAYREWYSVIASRTPFMRKIYLSFEIDLEDNLEAIDKLLTTTERKYSRLNLQGMYSERFQKMLVEKGKTLTHIVSDEAMEFESTTQFLNHLKIFQSSVQKLVVNGTIVDKNFDEKVDSIALELP